MRGDVSDSKHMDALGKKWNKSHHIRDLFVRTSSLIVLKSQTKCEACHFFKPQGHCTSLLCPNHTKEKKRKRN